MFSVDRNKLYILRFDFFKYYSSSKKQPEDLQILFNTVNKETKKSLGGCYISAVQTGWPDASSNLVASVHISTNFRTPAQFVIGGNRTLDRFLRSAPVLLDGYVAVVVYAFVAQWLRKGKESGGRPSSYKKRYNLGNEKGHFQRRDNERTTATVCTLCTIFSLAHLRIFVQTSSFEDEKRQRAIPCDIATTWRNRHLRSTIKTRRQASFYERNPLLLAKSSLFLYTKKRSFLSLLACDASI